MGARQRGEGLVEGDAYLLGQFDVVGGARHAQALGCILQQVELAAGIGSTGLYTGARRIEEDAHFHARGRVQWGAAIGFDHKTGTQDPKLGWSGQTS